MKVRQKTSSFGHVALVSAILLVPGASRGLFGQTTPSNGASSYVFGIGDEIEVSHWKNAELASTAVVRPDGWISLPLIGEVEVLGLTPSEVQQLLTAKYGEFVGAPTVTVLVQGINSRKIYIVGEVSNPGAYDLLRPLTVMQALALAGWLTDYAKKEDVLILRGESGRETRIPVDIKAVMSGKVPGQNVVLKPGDTVVVP